MVGIFSYAQFKKNSFNISEVLIDPTTGKMSLHALGVFIALVISSWGFVYITLHNQLSDWYYISYISVWTGANIADMYFGNRVAANANAGSVSPVSAVQAASALVPDNPD